MPRKNWDKLMERMEPARRDRIDELVREDIAQMLLAELRKLAGLTQEDLATMLGVKQATVSQMEHQDDMQISTLRRIVEALGGELEITVKMPTGRISVTPQFTA